MSATDLYAECNKCDLEISKAMNLLQDFGVISDNCINATDIAQADIPAAVKFISEYPF